MEQFSHAESSPLIYMELGQELGHTGNTPMAEAILENTFEHDDLSDDAYAAILKQLCKHPAVRQISQPIFTESDFKSAFKCVPEKTTLSFSGRGSTTTRLVPKAQKIGKMTSIRQFMPR
jgi:hypothetical protein